MSSQPSNLIIQAFQPLTAPFESKNDPKMPNIFVNLILEYHLETKRSVFGFQIMLLLSILRS